MSLNRKTNSTWIFLIVSTLFFISAVLWAAILNFSERRAIEEENTVKTDINESVQDTVQKTEIAHIKQEPTPENGYVFVDVYSELSEEDRPCCFVFANMTSHPCYVSLLLPDNANPQIAFFVEANNMAAKSIPAGEYELRFAHGAVWKNSEQLFGAQNVCYQDEDLYEFRSEKKGNSSWTVVVGSETEEQNYAEIYPMMYQDFKHRSRTYMELCAAAIVARPKTSKELKWEQKKKELGFDEIDYEPEEPLDAEKPYYRITRTHDYIE